MNCFQMLMSIVILQFFIFSIILYSLLNEIDLLTKKKNKPEELCLAESGPTNILNSEKISKSVGLLTLKRGSSVVCHGSTKKDRICRFQNLCYQSKWKQYLFFHGPWSSMQGLPKNRFDPALLDLTSVDDHNTQYFNFVDFPVEAVDDFQEIEFIELPSLLFHRLNPANLMHTIHDDIIPLFMTMKRFLSTKFANTTNSNLQLVCMDGRGQDNWSDLYKTLTDKPILLKSNLTAELTCFTDVFVGLAKDTTWYQYGFKIPQGPIDNKTIKRSHLDLFVKHTKYKLNCTSVISDYVIMVSRKRTRIIMNQVEVSMTLANLFKKEVIFLDMEDHTIKDAICLVSNAAAVVGMHGAELILSLFLPMGSYLIELFPYKVNPDHYTPYKTLATLMNLNYMSWRNIYASNTKTYPERSAKLGGINHLSEKLKMEILQAEEVPRHLCCYDPNWLFRIYQDTYVDILSFEEQVRKFLQDSPSLQTENSLKSNNEHLMPDVVRSITCLTSENLNSTVLLSISWVPPVNAKYIKKDLKYQLILQEMNNNEATAFETEGTTIKIVKNKQSAPFCLWIRCKFHDDFGPLSGLINCTEL